MLHHLVQGGYGNSRCYLVDDGIFVGNARNRFVVEEVTDIFLYIAFILTLVAFLESRFQMAQIFCTGTAVLGFGKAELACTLDFAENG